MSFWDAPRFRFVARRSSRDMLIGKQGLGESVAYIFSKTICRFLRYRNTFAQRLFPTILECRFENSFQLVQRVQRFFWCHIVGIQVSERAQNGKFGRFK